MKTFLKLLYNLIIIPLLFLSAKAIALVSNKAREREENYLTTLANIPEKSGKRILFHSASMGEFEQVKYLIEILRERKPEIEIIVSFFSPSGFNNLSDKQYYDHKVYIPLDTSNNASEFVERIDPDLVVFVRYDLWLNIVKAFKEVNIPVYLINATFTKSRTFGKKFLGKHLYKMILENVSKIYTVNEYNYNKFIQLGPKTDIEIVADTRYDRVLSKVRNSNVSFHFNFPDDNKIIVAGSTWIQDEEILEEASSKLRTNGYKFNIIYVPHEPNERNVKRLKSSIHNIKIYSHLKENQMIKRDLLIDKVGLLLDIYKLADIAYVGGGFGTGVHSVTEPAGYGLPIICGSNKYYNSEDAVKLRKLNSLKTVSNSKELYKALRLFLENEVKSRKMGLVNKKFIEDNAGSSEIIYNQLFKGI